MLRTSLLLLLLLLGGKALAQSTYETRARQYIEKFRLMAIAEQIRTGVPAAITLAQGIHETAAGASELATEANNHFGIKCKSSWKGMTFAHTDDAPNECFRKYTSAEESYRDHSDYLRQNQRYAQLFTFSITDYASWAVGLKKCGYATNPRYAQVLIKLIEDYKLQEYTYAALDKNNIGSGIAEVVPEQDNDPGVNPEAAPSATISNTPPPAAAPTATTITTTETPAPIGPQPAPGEQLPNGVVRINGLKAVYAFKGETLLPYAIKHNIRYARLLEMNDMADAPLAANTYIYLERKNMKGYKATHVVKPGETLGQISQLEGMQLKALMNLNKLAPGDMPVPGTVLQLQQYATAKPEVTTSQVTVSNSITNNNATPYRNTFMSKPNVQGRVVPAQDTVVEYVQPATVRINPRTTTTAPAANPRVTSAPVTTPVATPPVASTGTTPGNYSAAYADEEETEEPATETPAPQTQKLNALKSRFDQAVYGSNNKPTPPASASPEPTVSTAPATTPSSTVSPALPPQELPQSVVDDNDPSKFYTVKKGDTAFSIAKNNNITMRELMEWNKLDFDAIKEGQKLRIKP